MLQDGELVGIVADVVQQPQHQPRRDLAAADRHRPGDRRAQLVAVIRGTRYWPSLTASGSPWNSMQSPMKSERIVMTT